jgi:hypothetical protein
MTCKTAVTVIAGHELLPTDRRSTRAAGCASAARNHCWNNHGSSYPTAGVFADSDDPAGDFVPKDERKRMARRHTIKCKPDIRMTDTAARNLNNDFVRAGSKLREFARLQWSVGNVQPESIRPLNAGQHEPLPVPKENPATLGEYGRTSHEAVTAVTA